MEVKKMRFNLVKTYTDSVSTLASIYLTKWSDGITIWETRWKGPRNIEL